MPADADTNNIYMVTVKAEAGGEMEMLEVTVTVTDVSELGTLAGSSGFPHAEGGTDTGETYTFSGGDGSTVSWMLDGADASQFMLDGTGMSKMLKFRSAPDYEMPADADTNNIYMVTVKAEAGGEMDMVEVNVTITDVIELGTLAGNASLTPAEGGTDTGGTYTVSGGDGSTVSWMLNGADASQFMLDGTGMGRMLMFRSAPDYEMPADADTNNTYMVTVKAEAGGEIQMVEVTVRVTDVDELGALSGPGSFTQAEGGTDAMETYTLSGGDGTSTVSWTLAGADASQFTLAGTGMSRMLMFESAPDYEMPRGQAMSDTNTNTYMVTVKAEAGSEMQMVEVTVTVTDVEEPGSVTLTPARPSVGTEITATLEDDDMVSSESWQWAKHAATADDSMPAEDSADWMNIAGATDASYEPVDADANMWLRAMATYTDGFGSGNTAMAVSASAVSQVAVNVAPEFESAATTRTIPENTAAGSQYRQPRSWPPTTMTIP